MSKPIPFGKYTLLDRINVGGMAEVFKAKAFGVEGFERLVAVKRILPNIAEDEEFITMFIDEAKIAVQLQHATIAQIFDLGKVDDSYFIALEYVHGKDLRAIFDHMRKAAHDVAEGLADADTHMPIAQICYIMMQVCEGLDYAHNKRDSQGRELNLVHRDVSPQNILVGYEGEVKLVDFGIAKAAGKASKTQAGILKGKFGYMSPEQVRGLPVDRRSDIFSVGICLYEVLTNERLFVGESDFSTLEKVRNVEILPPTSFNRDIPAELERIVLKALAKDVDDRYQNAIDLHDDLQAFLYSLGELYSRKDLAAWMKRTFADEIARENVKFEQYRHVVETTPAPGRSSRNDGAGSYRKAAAPAASQAALSWDEEELETQIFDKAPETAIDTRSLMDEPSEPRRSAHNGYGAQPGAQLGGGRPSSRRDVEPDDVDAELDSSDIFVGTTGGTGGRVEGMFEDDKTVAGLPPEDLLGDLGGGDSNAPTPRAFPGPNYGQPQAHAPVARGNAPQPADADLDAQLTPRPAPTLMGVGAGPPPGLGAFRPGSNGASPLSSSDLFGSLNLPSTPGPAANPPPGSSNGGFGYGGAPASASPRQTLIGMPYAQAPQPATGYAGGPGYVPGGAPPRHGTAAVPASGGRKPQSRTLTFILVGAVAVVALGLVFRQFTRPGKLNLVVTPADAEVLVDGKPEKGTGPFVIERPAGLYHVQVRREGYDEKNQNVELESGAFKTVDVALTASSLTGFELTSDPPGGLVWMDGKPFTGTGAAGGQQVRTNFKAYRVTPGRHVLEIKGDPRFGDWRYEFLQEPSKILKIQAQLEPAGGSRERQDEREAAAAKPAVAAANTPKPTPAPRPEPATRPEPPAPTEPTAAAAPARPAAPKPTAPAAAERTPTPVAAASTGSASGLEDPSDTEKPAAAPRPARPVRKPAARDVAVAEPADTAAEPAKTETARSDEAVADTTGARAGGECTITVGSKPWSEVWIDGKNTGKLTPLIDFKLPCGKHKLTFKNSDLKIEHDEPVKLKAGEKFKKVVHLVDTDE